ncbi:hypothetical protein MANI_003366 [Metarhizium anisopliae]|nr:hypothetical protein MANI_003366 [Metarhizium anisopliae]
MAQPPGVSPAKREPRSRDATRTRLKPPRDTAAAQAAAGRLLTAPPSHHPSCRRVSWDLASAGRRRARLAAHVRQDWEPRVDRPHGTTDFWLVGRHRSPHRNPVKARRYETDSSPGMRPGPFDPFGPMHTLKRILRQWRFLELLFPSAMPDAPALKVGLLVAWPLANSNPAGSKSGAFIR